jgi:regulator of microtubule dynamics protein 3
MSIKSKTTFLLFIIYSLVSNVFAQGNGYSKEDADRLFVNMEYEKAIEYYKILLEKNTNDYELNWKIARVYINYGEIPGNEKKEYFDLAKKYAEKSIVINPNGSDGMTFLAAAIGNLAYWGDTRMKIDYSWQMRNLLIKALKINSNDHIALSILGSLEHMLANVSWIERALASMAYGSSLPPGSYEESIQRFLKAISIDSTLIRHHYELALVYREIKDYENAKKEFFTALRCPVQLKADNRRIELIKEYLKEIK